jgi:hypothetical protein
MPSEKSLQDIPRHLVIEYFHPTKAEDFVLSTNTWVQRNVKRETFGRLKPQLKNYNNLYEDVKPGDRYSLTYIPYTGTILALNVKPKGTIPGAEFSSALFSIWIGKESLSDDLRDSLLRVQ